MSFPFTMGGERYYLAPTSYRPAGRHAYTLNLVFVRLRSLDRVLGVALTLYALWSMVFGHGARKHGESGT